MTNPVTSPGLTYSPVIDMVIEVDDEEFEMLELALKFNVLANPRKAVSCLEGVPSISVDGGTDRKCITLPSGVEPNRNRQPLAASL